MNQALFFRYYHHLINPRLYTEDQIKQRNHTILVANWKRMELEQASTEGGQDGADHQAETEMRPVPA